MITQKNKDRGPSYKELLHRKLVGKTTIGDRKFDCNVEFQYVINPDLAKAVHALELVEGNVEKLYIDCDAKTHNVAKRITGADFNLNQLPAIKDELGGLDNGLLVVSDVKIEIILSQ
jgi:hypothetical protein